MVNKNLYNSWSQTIDETWRSTYCFNDTIKMLSKSMISALKESIDRGFKLKCKSVTQKALFSRFLCDENGVLTNEGKTIAISSVSLKRQADLLDIPVRKMEFSYPGYPLIKVKNYMNNFYDYTNPDHYKALVNYELLKTKVFPEILAGNKLIKDNHLKFACFDEGKSIFTLLTCMCHNELCRAWDESEHDLSDVRNSLHSITLLSLMTKKNGFYSKLSEKLIGAVYSAKIENILDAFLKIKDTNSDLVDNSNNTNCIGISRSFLETLYQSLGNKILAKILKIYLIDPNAFGKGWPDITAIGHDNNVKLFEIKTIDKLHISQLNTFSEIKNIFDIEIIKCKKASA